MSDSQPILVEESDIKFELYEDETDHGDTNKTPFPARLKTTKSNDEKKRFTHTFHKNGACIGDDHLIDLMVGDEIIRVRDGEGVIQLKDGDEIVGINYSDVTSWSHDQLVTTIRHLKKVTLIFYRKTEFEAGLLDETDELYIEISFEIDDISLGSDCKGGAVTAGIATIKKITAKFRRRITFSPHVSLKFKGQRDIKIQHGAIRHKYMMARGDQPFMDEIHGSNRADAFRMWDFEAFSSKGAEPMAAFQCKSNNKFLMCRLKSSKLSLCKDDHMGEHMDKVSSSNPVMFKLIVSSDNNGFYLESAAYPGHFLCYDAVDLLQVESPDVSPASPDFMEDDCVRRNYVFDLV